MNTWFTSDHHFDHDKIILYCKRPFKNGTEQNEEMIERWNEIVCPEDTVYHLGDFTLGGKNTFLKFARRLNGDIRFIPGGHDYQWLVKGFGYDPIDGLTLVSHDLTAERGQMTLILPPMFSLPIQCKGEKDLPLVMNHYPMMSWDRSHYGSPHLHGHVHNSWKNRHSDSGDTQLPPGQKKGVRINVSVDVWDFYPVGIHQILDIAGIDGILRT
jgi:calcineurin-like phosphoesterase family protein